MNKEQYMRFCENITDCKHFRLGYGYVDAETMTLHHDKHHATYVANANAALEKHPEIGDDLEKLLADVESIPEDIRQALINNGGGHLNHALFWELLSPEKTSFNISLQFS